MAQQLLQPLTSTIFKLINRHFSSYFTIDPVNPDGVYRWIDWVGCWAGCVHILVYNGIKVRLKFRIPDAYVTNVSSLFRTGLSTLCQVPNHGPGL